MKELTKKIPATNTSFVSEQENPTKYESMKETFIAFTCVSFFPLVYLIGSSIVQYFG